MLSIKLDEDQVGEVRSWAERLGITPSELVRDALRRYLTELREEDGVAAGTYRPFAPEESSGRSVAAWGPDEDWSDWRHRAG